MINNDEVLVDDILSGKPQIPHGKEFQTDKCIAMLHGAVAIRNTQYEGIEEIYAFKYFQQLYQLSNRYFNLGISSEQLNAAQEAMADLIYFDSLLKSFIQFKYSDGTILDHTHQKDKKDVPIEVIINIDVNKIILGIRDRSISRGYCYMPSGWLGNKTGHFVGLKLNHQQEQRYSCCYIDRGAGIINHKPLAVSGEKLKRDYQSEPFMIDFSTADGTQFLEEMVRLNIDSRLYVNKEKEITQHRSDTGQPITVTISNDRINHYSYTDLHGLPVRYSEGFLQQQNSLLNAVTPQRTGTCTISNTKMVGQDAISSGFKVDLAIIKRFKFGIKLISLIEAFKAYLHQQCSYELVYWSLQEFYIRINKHYPEILNDKELAFCTQIGLAISRCLVKDHTEMLEQKCSAKPLPPLEGTWRQLKHLLRTQEHVSPPRQPEKKVIQEKILQKNGCKPDQIVDYLEQAINYFQDKKSIFDLMELRLFMHSLAKTSGVDSDAYWDLVPIQQLAIVIEKLEQIVRSLRISSSNVYAYQFEIELIAYDIVAQIASKIPELQLMRGYALVLDDVYSDKHDFFDAMNYHTVKHIAANFALRCANKRIILSNAVNYDDTDKTQTYIMKLLLTTEAYRQAIMLLKDKKAIERHVTHIDENELFVILMTKSCEVTNEHGKKERVAFETEKILGIPFTNILTLAAKVHSYQRPKTAYSIATQEKDQFNLSSLNSAQKQSNKLYFDVQAYHEEIKLNNYLQNPHNSNQAVGIEKHFPHISLIERSHSDFSENTIYHPHDDLMKKRQQLSQANQYTSFYNQNKKEEIIPYKIDISGSLRINTYWNSYENALKDSEELDEDLRSIETSPNLQVARALEWGQYYIEKLKNSNVRKRLEELLFCYEKLDIALATAFDDTVQLINQFLDAGYHYYLNRALSKECTFETYEAFLWLCEIHFILANYIKVSAKLYQFEISHCRLPYINNFLLEKINSLENQQKKAILAGFLLVNYYNYHDLTKEDYLTLLQCHILSNLYPSLSGENTTKAKFMAETAWLEHRDALQTFLASLMPVELNIHINNIMKSCLNHTVECDWQIEKSLLKATNGDYSVDLNTGLFSRGQQRQNDLTTELRSSNFEILGKLRLLKKEVINTLYEASPNLIKSDNGEYEIHCPYSGTYRYIKAINRNLKVEGVNRKYKLFYNNRDDHKELDNYFNQQKMSNPFEKTNGKKFCYWLSEEPENTLFVNDPKNPELAFFRSPDSGWVQLIAQNNEWIRNGYVIFDLGDPQSDIEKKWTLKLAQMIGYSGAIVTAQMLSENECRIESINLSELSLQFVNNNNRLESVEYPGYFLSEKQSLIQLKGLTTIIILVNEFGDEKYFIPHFNLKKANGNSALSCDDIIDNSEINHEFSKNGLYYFIYEINKNGDLVGNNLEADAYIAVLHGALGDYERAMRALKRTEHHTNNSKEISAIFELLTVRQDQSPLGAAWAIKVASRMYRHMFKWAKQANQFWVANSSFNLFLNSDDTPALIKFTYAQYLFYQQSISHYKTGINIVPDYLRINEEDRCAISNLMAMREQKENKRYPLTLIKPPQGAMHRVLVNERLDKIAILEYCKNANYEEISNYIVDDLLKPLGLVDRRHKRQKDQYHSSLRIYFDMNEKIYFDNVRYEYGADYLKRYFVNFFEDAISNDAVKIKRLKATLYGILQNDTFLTENIVLMSTLIFVIQNPTHFKDVPRKDTTRECFSEVAKVCYKCVAKYKLPIKLNLFDLYHGQINYTNEVSLANPFINNQSLQFNLSAINIDPIYQYPLQVLFTKYFQSSMQAVAKRDFVLDKPGMANPSLLEKNILDRLRAGHIANQGKQKTIYKLASDANLLELKKQLKRCTLRHLTEKSDQSVTAVNDMNGKNSPRLNIVSLIEQEPKDDQYAAMINIKKILKDREAELLKLANYTPLDSDQADEKAKLKAYFLLAARGGQQLSALEINDLITCLLTQDVSKLASKNCFLDQQRVTTILEKLCDYLLLQSRYDQIEEALRQIGNCQSIAELGKYKEQLLGSIFDSRRDYDIKKYPEFLIYEYATKRMLRPDQANALIDLINLITSGSATEEDIKHALLQFAAGGGKTSVLIVILAFVFARLGIMPVIFNTSELYDIAVSDIPDYLKASLQQNMEVIERELEHCWTSAEFEKLYNDLCLWHKQKKCVLLKAVTWHSIFIAKRIAKAESIIYPEKAKANEDLANSANRILEFFKNKTVKLEDENQIISDPLQETIKTYGPMQAVPMDQLKLFVRYYDFLMNYEGDCDDIARDAGIIDKSKKVVNDKILERLQIILANKICQEECFQKLNKESLLSYLLQASRKRPSWWYELLRQDEQTADLVILARSFIKTHLPHILSLQFAKNYGYSIHKGDLTAAPKHDGIDVTFHFSDHMLVVALTIQLYAQQGVPPAYVVKIISDIEADHLRERKWNKDITDAEQFLNNILPANYSFIYLDNITEADKENMSLCDDIRFNPGMLKEFLYQYALRQIRTPKYRVVSTPADLQSGFLRSVMFSATPGLRETLPVFLQEKNCYFDAAFEAQVLDTLLQEKNAQYCLIEMTHSPQEFFKQIRQSYPQLMALMGTLIDRGALLSNADGKSVINAYLEGVNSADARATALCFEKEFMVLRSKHARIGEINIPGSRLAEALKRKGINPETFLLFLFLELSKTTGTDVKRPHNDCAGLTVGKEQTLVEIIQAAMRERLFLWENAQTIIWIMFKSLYADIYPGVNEFNPLYAIYWMVHNQAGQDATKIVMRSYQGIYQQLEKIVWDKIDKGAVPYSQYHERLQKSYTLSPHKIYELESTMESSDKVLNDYANDMCTFFGHVRTDLPTITQQRIAQINDDTTKLIENMRQPHGAELSAQVTQEQQALTENKQEIEQEQKLKSLYDRHTHFTFNLEQYHFDRDQLNYIFEQQNNFQYQLLQLKNCGHIKMPALLINRFHFSPIQLPANMEKTIQLLKPINALLVRIDQQNNLQFLACTATGVDFYRHQMITLKDHNNLSYMLVGANGKVLFSTTNLSREAKQQLVKSEIVQEIIVFVAFLNGRIKNPLKLSQIVQKYQWSKEDFERLVSAISEVHVSRHPIKLTNIAKFERLCGWRNDKQHYPQYDKNLATKQMQALPQQSLQAVVSVPQRVCNVTVENELKTALPGCILKKQPRPRKVLPRNISLTASKPPAALSSVTSARADNNESLTPPALARPSFAEIPSTLFSPAVSVQPDININDVRKNLLASGSAAPRIELINDVDSVIVGRRQLTKESFLQVVNRACQDYLRQNMSTGFFGFFQAMLSRHGETGRQNASLFLTHCRQAADINQMIDLILNHIKSGPGNFRPASFKTILMRNINEAFSLQVRISNGNNVAASHVNFCNALESKKVSLIEQHGVASQRGLN